MFYTEIEDTKVCFGKYIESKKTFLGLPISSLSINNLFALTDLKIVMAMPPAVVMESMTRMALIVLTNIGDLALNMLSSSSILELAVASSYKTKYILVLTS